MWNEIRKMEYKTEKELKEEIDKEYWELTHNDESEDYKEGFYLGWIAAIGKINRMKLYKNGNL